MNSLIGVWAPFGVLFLFLYRAFVPSEVNVSVLLEDHAMDLGCCLVAMAWMSVNLLKGAPKPAPLPEPVPEPSPEPAPEPSPDDSPLPEPDPGPVPDETPDEPKPEPAPEPVKQVRKFKV